MKQLTSTLMDHAWRCVLEQVVPSETHPLQVRTYKRFYYAGAKHVLDELMEEADLTEDDDLSDTDKDRLGAVLRELNEFFVEVAAGRE